MIIEAEWPRTGALNGVRDDAQVFVVDARGWPFPALWCKYHKTLLGGPRVEGGFVLGTVLPDLPDNLGPGAFPYWPIWSGLLIDTAAYGGAWWIALLGVGMLVSTLRATIRRRRGQCPRCGYSLTGLAAGSPCPECGPKAP